MIDSLKAIPTEYAGVRFKSRLEARFAEYLDAVPARWVYEPKFPGENPSYQPDFFLQELELYVEIKPEARLNELKIFWTEIERCSAPFVCLDKSERDEWSLLASNCSFSGGLKINIPSPIRIELWNCRDGKSRVTLVLNFNPFFNIH